MGAGNFVSNNCRVIPTRLTATTITTILTATGYTSVVGVRLVNFHASSTPTISLLYKPVGSAVNFFVQANYVMPVATSLWFPFDAFGVKEDDTLLAQASIANCVDALVFVAEVPGRSA